MPKHVDALFRPEPAGTPTALVALTELELLHVAQNVMPTNTLGNYATGRSLHRKLAAALADLDALACLDDLRADVRRVHDEDQIRAGLHDRGRFTPAD